MRSGRGAALVVALAVLSGCSPQWSAPARLTDSEINAVLYEQQALWWTSSNPGVPLPQIDVVEYVNPFEPSSAMADCILEANIPGISFDGRGWSFESSEEETGRLFGVAQALCRMKYPYDPAYAELMGIMSADQLDYLYVYMTDRLLPCLKLMGYTIREDAPSREAFVSAAPYLTWNAYDAMLPPPDTAEEWRRVDSRCPPPAIKFFMRAGIDYGVVD